MRGSALNFVPRGIPGGRNFCPAHAGRNGFPLERGAFATRCSVEERRRKLWRAEKGEMGSFQSVQKVHKKLPQISSILRVQSGRRENLLTKWIYFLLKRVPQTLDAGTARTSRRRLRHPTVPPPMPGNRRAADRLLTLSTPVEFSYRTAPALLLFHGAVFFVSRPCAHIVRLGLFLLLLPKLPAAC